MHNKKSRIYGTSDWLRQITWQMWEAVEGRKWEAEVGGQKWEAMLPWLAQIDLSESPSQSGEHLGLPPQPPTSASHFWPPTFPSASQKYIENDQFL